MTQKQIQINEENPYLLILAYGSLRLGGSNYEHFLEGKSIFIAEVTTDPVFSMYSLGNFPVLTLGNTSIKCDLFKIRSNKVLQDIFRLEGCNGKLNSEQDLYRIKEVNTKYGLAYIFWMPEYKGSEENIIKSGDWNSRKFIKCNLLTT